MDTFHYNAGDERPALTLPWQEETSQGVWTDLDLSSGYTFSLTLTLLVRSGTSSTAALTKTTNITGNDGSVTVTWAAGELALTPGEYELQLTATTGGVDRSYSPGNPIKIHIH